MNAMPAVGDQRSIAVNWKGSARRKDARKSAFQAVCRAADSTRMASAERRLGEASEGCLRARRRARKTR